MWAGSRLPKVWGDGAVADFPLLLQYVGFSPLCVPRNLQESWNWKTAGMGMLSLAGLEGLEPVWGSKELQSQSKAGYRDGPIRQDGQSHCPPLFKQQGLSPAPLRVPNLY